MNCPHIRMTKAADRRRPVPRMVYPPFLPILERRKEIVEAIHSHPVVIITGETGSGKTTQIPKMCLEAGRGRTGVIGCTQPRRIAATTVARRIAEELGEEIGRSVGYKIRFDDRTPRQAIFKIMTDGILLMEAQRDPLLSTYDTIIVDEAHERTLNIDFLLGILKATLPRRPDMRVIITSATIDTQKFSQAFGCAPIIEVSGRLYPVEVRYRPIDTVVDDGEETTVVEAAVQVIDDIIAARERGDILVFMPTERDIRETCELLAGRVGDDAEIIPLFSRLPTSQQHRVFMGTVNRKIVVATNIAETSITIPGIRFVIDTGLARITQYNPRSRTTGLPVRAISRSSADQRKGRCGRVQNGICIRLYTEEEYLSRPLYTPPEILRSNLASVILRMLALGLGNIDAFPFIDRPTVKSVRDGLEILRQLGAIEPGRLGQGEKAPSWQLTERGRLMARLPLDPRISRMILEASKEGCLTEITVIAAALAIQDPRERPVEKEAQADQAHALFKDPVSDFSALLGLWKRCHGWGGDSLKTLNQLRHFCHDHFLSYRRMREWRDVREQIVNILTEQKILPVRQNTMRKHGEELYTALHRSILSGYLGHIALKKEKNIYTATQGRQAMLFPGSGLFNRGGNWIVAAEMVETSRLFARTAANIESAWLEELGGDLCRRTHAQVRWDKKRGEVVATEQVTLFGLPIVSGRSVSYGRIDPEESARVFIRSALVEAEVAHPLPFLTHNQALIDRLMNIEDKVRRRDLLVGEDEIERFYEKRLPGIFDIRSLRRLIRDRGGDDFLRMCEEDLLVRAPDPDELRLYPEVVKTGGWRLDLRYRFEPGMPLDGVTLRVPVQAVPAIRPESLDWAVPGLLRDKVMALLKGLPKRYRKELMPLEKTCGIIIREMIQEGALPTALGRFIFARFGIDIPSQSWPLDQLNEHLKLRISVVDQDERELAAGRDMEILRREFVEAYESDRLVQARQDWEKVNLREWDFGDLPETIALPWHGGHMQPAFPALTAEEDGVALRLFRSPSEAALSHRKGVRALLALKSSDAIRQLRKAVKPGGELTVWASAFGGAKLLENAIVEKVLVDLFEADVRTREDFQKLAEGLHSAILPRGLALLRQAGPLLKALYDTTEQFRSLEMANRDNRPLLGFLGGLREESHRLLPPDFLLRYDSERLNHIGRYLRALGIRAERGAVHLEKALGKGKEISELLQWHESMIANLPLGASREKREALDNFIWLVEEYKVSVFAQELKTAVPISRKRIDACMGEIQRMV